MSMVIVTTTLPTEEAADLLATQMVEEKLAVCAQVIGPIESTYWWEGVIERSEEWYCHFKALPPQRDPLMARVKALHPYEIPEIIAVATEAVGAEYLGWAQGQLEN